MDDDRELTQLWLPIKVVSEGDGPVILESALTHDVKKSDILHALKFAHGPVAINHERWPPTVIYVGTGTSGVVWYEVGNSKHDDHPVPFVVHADRARQSYLRKAGVK